MTDTRFRWELAEEPPEGWRFAYDDYSRETGKVYSLFVCPEWPECREHVWIENLQVEQKAVRA